jgi:hypothetical protein
LDLKNSSLCRVPTMKSLNSRFQAADVHQTLNLEVELGDPALRWICGLSGSSRREPHQPSHMFLGAMASVWHPCSKPGQKAEVIIELPVAVYELLTHEGTKLFHTLQSQLWSPKSKF